MKIIKLNRRYTQYRDYHHQVGVRFPEWDSNVTKLREALTEITGSYGWFRDHAWFSYYGKKSGHQTVRPFFITVRDESVLTMALMKVKHD